jgi:death-on-curing protein
LLDATLSRLQTSYQNSSEQEAAALRESLSRSRPFIDGNKRTAFACMVCFSEINGRALSVTTKEMQSFLPLLHEYCKVNIAYLLPWFIQYKQ